MRDNPKKRTAISFNVIPTRHTVRTERGEERIKHLKKKQSKFLKVIPLPELIPSPTANEVIRLGLKALSDLHSLGGAGLEVIQIAFGSRLYPD